MNTKAIEGASNEALAAMAYLARLDEADRATVLRAFGLALGPRLWRVQDGQSLPTLTGIVEDRERERIYASSAWQQAYRPSRTLVIYVLQTAGLREAVRPARRGRDIEGRNGRTGECRAPDPRTRAC